MASDGASFAELAAYKCDCGDHESVVSPTAYLADLLEYVTDDGSGSGHVKDSEGVVSIDDLETTFHQPFGDLAADPEAAQETVRHVRITVESLLGYLEDSEGSDSGETLVLVGDDSSGSKSGVPAANETEAYRRAAYTALLDQWGVTREDLRTAAYDEDERAWVAEAIGVPEWVVPDLWFDRDAPLDRQYEDFPGQQRTSLFESTNKTFPISETNLEDVFGLPALTKPTDKGRTRADPLRTIEEPYIRMWRIRYLRSEWSAEDHPTDEYPAHLHENTPYTNQQIDSESARPIVDPDLIGPDDFRVIPANKSFSRQGALPSDDEAFTLWETRRSWLDGRLESIWKKIPVKPDDSDDFRGVLNEMLDPVSYSTGSGERVWYPGRKNKPSKVPASPSSGANGDGPFAGLGFLQDLGRLHRQLTGDAETAETARGNREKSTFPTGDPDDSPAEAARTLVQAELHLTERSFRRLVELLERYYGDEGTLGEAEWWEVTSILAGAEKRSLFEVWIDEEKNKKDVHLDRKTFWQPRREPQQGEWSFRLDSHDPVDPEKDPEPYIDPERMDRADLPERPRDEQGTKGKRKAAHELYEDRQRELRNKRQSITETFENRRRKLQSDFESLRTTHDSTLANLTSGGSTPKNESTIDGILDDEYGSVSWPSDSEQGVDGKLNTWEKRFSWIHEGLQLSKKKGQSGSGLSSGEKKHVKKVEGKLDDLRLSDDEFRRLHRLREQAKLSGPGAEGLQPEQLADLFALLPLGNPLDAVLSTVYQPASSNSELRSVYADPKTPHRWDPLFDEITRELEDDSSGSTGAGGSLPPELETLGLSPEEFESVLLLRRRARPGPDPDPPSEALVSEVMKILTSAWKRKKHYTTGRDSWLTLERDRGDFPNYWDARKARLPKWRATPEDRAQWQEALYRRSSAPIVDPDLIEGVDDFETPAWEKDAFDLWKDRKDFLFGSQGTALVSEVEQLRVDAETGNHKLTSSKASQARTDIDAALERTVGVTLSDLRAIAREMERGNDVGAGLARLDLSTTALSYILEIDDNLGTQPIRVEEWESMKNILLRAWKQRQYGRWNREERAFAVNLEPQQFDLPDPDDDRKPPDEDDPLRWRVDWSIRNEWEDVLENRIEELETVDEEVETAVAAAEKEALPVLRKNLLDRADAGGAVKATNGSSDPSDRRAEWLSERLLIDTEMHGERETTRTSQAITSLQDLLGSLDLGLDEQNSGLTDAGLSLDDDEFDRRWQWLGTYDKWKAAMGVYTYPENVLLPTMRSASTPMFDTLASQTVKNPSLDAEAGRAVAEKYSEYFRDITGLHIQFACAGSHPENDSTVVYVFATPEGTGRETLYYRILDPTVKHPTDPAGFWRRAGPTTDLADRELHDVANHDGTIYLLCSRNKNDKRELGTIQYSVDDRSWAEFDPFDFELKKLGDGKLGRSESTRSDHEWYEIRRAFVTAQFANVRGSATPPEVFIQVNEQTVTKLKDVSSQSYFESKYRRLFHAGLGASGEPPDKEELTELRATGITYFGGQRRSEDRLGVDVESLVTPVRSVVGRRNGGEWSYLLSFDDMWYYYAPKSPFESVPGSQPPNTTSGNPDWIMYAPFVTDDGHFAYLSSEVDEVYVEQGTDAMNWSGTTLDQGLFGHISLLQVNNVPENYGYQADGDWLSCVLINQEPIPVQFYEACVRIRRGNNKYEAVETTTLSPRLSPLNRSKSPFYVPTAADSDLDKLDQYRTAAADLRKANSTPLRRATLPYLDEAQYFVPLFVARQLSGSGSYEAALDWFRTVYDYTRNVPAKRTVWPGFDAIGTRKPRSEPGIGWLLDPINPHKIAETRANPYVKFTLFSIIRCLSEYADDEFAQDTPKTVANATDLYEQALDLLERDVLHRDQDPCRNLVERLNALILFDVMEPEIWTGEPTLSREDVEAKTDELVRVVEGIDDHTDRRQAVSEIGTHLNSGDLDTALDVANRYQKSERDRSPFEKRVTTVIASMKGAGNENRARERNVVATANAIRSGSDNIVYPNAMPAESGNLASPNATNGEGDRELAKVDVLESVGQFSGDNLDVAGLHGSRTQLPGGDQFTGREGQWQAKVRDPVTDPPSEDPSSEDSSVEETGTKSDLGTFTGTTDGEKFDYNIKPAFDFPWLTPDLTEEGATTVDTATMDFLEATKHHFCVPKNPLLTSLRRHAAVNLRKIRSGRNIAGMKRDLDPYTSSVSVESATPTPSGGVGTTGGGTQPTNYRYDTLVERAKELAEQARQFESELLTAIEKAEREEYKLKKARQQIELAEQRVSLQETRLKRAHGKVELARLRREKARIRRTTYQEWINHPLVSAEREAMDTLETAILLQKMAAALHGGAGYLHIGAAATHAVAAGIYAGTGKVGAGVSEGAAALSSAAAAFSSFAAGLSTQAGALSTRAQIEQIRARKQRRRRRWDLKKKIAEQNYEIGTQRIQIARDTVDIVRQERQIARLRSDHAEDIVNFHENKFTNQELFQWIADVLEGVYRYFLQQAASVAKMAQRQLAFKRQGLPREFVQSDYWDAPTQGQTAVPAAQDGQQGQGNTDRRGMTGSARLLQDIYELDQYEFRTDERRLQVEKTVSVSELDPMALQQFRETGVLSFATTLEDFDVDHPGHYHRMIEDVEVNVVALTPPTEGINATLRNSGTSRIVVGETLFQEKRIERDPETIVLNRARGRERENELRLRPRDREMLRPFEHSGVATDWELEMARPANDMDYSTIVDVQLTVEYSALESSDYRKRVISELAPERTVERSFSFHDDFGDAWYDLVNAPDDADSTTVTFGTDRDDFPSNLYDLSLDSARLYFVVPGPNRSDKRENLKDLEVEFGPADGSGTKSKATNGTVDLGSLDADSLDSEWELTVTPTGMGNPFADGTIDDVLLIATAEGETPNWPP